MQSSRIVVMKMPDGKIIVDFDPYTNLDEFEEKLKLHGVEIIAVATLPPLEQARPEFLAALNALKPDEGDTPQTGGWGLRFLIDVMFNLGRQFGLRENRRKVNKG